MKLRGLTALEVATWMGREGIAQLIREKMRSQARDADGASAREATRGDEEDEQLSRAIAMSLEESGPGGEEGEIDPSQMTEYARICHETEPAIDRLATEDAGTAGRRRRRRKRCV